MAVDDKIRKLIQVIKDTEINELEITSFWGAQKIKLTKNVNKVIQKTTTSKENISKEPISSSVKDKEIIIEEKKSEQSTQNSVIQEENETLEQIEPLDENDNTLIQKAPLVGTFYRSSKPDEPAFVEVGDKVTKGQTLCIIEAMKIFNEIESDFNGIILEILIEDSNPVEFDQSLFKIKPE